MARRTVEFVRAGCFARWMRRRGWAGVAIVLPLVTVVLFWLEPSTGERVHEGTHAEQAERWGFVGWWARYLWGMRLGYRRNPLEREAYAVQGACEGKEG